MIDVRMLCVDITHVYVYMYVLSSLYNWGCMCGILDVSVSIYFHINA